METKRPKFIVSGLCTKNCGFKIRWQINPYMKIGATSFNKAQRQHDRLLGALENAGAEVLRVGYVDGAHDSVFMKDNAIVIEGENGPEALLARLKTKERAIEPKARDFQLRALGVRVRGQSEEYLEGGDVVMSLRGHRVAFMGFGFRTNKEAAIKLSRFLGVGVIPLELKDPYFYHLDTALSLTPYRGGLAAFTCRDAFTPQSWRALCAHPALDRIVEISRQEALRFALNWVECNGRIIMGAEAPATASLLRSLGKEVQVVKLSQFQLAGGSAACLVAGIHDFKSAEASRLSFA